MSVDGRTLMIAKDIDNKRSNDTRPVIKQGHEGDSPQEIEGPEAHRDPVRRIRLEIDPLVAPSEMTRPSDLLAFGPEVPLQYLLPMKDPKRLSFAIKRHRATRLHTDFRFEAFGRLLSWASYEKPSMNPDKAIFLREMGDHDPKYLRSERRIPDGSYGAGPMIVWDYGTYGPLRYSRFSPEAAVVEMLQNGQLDFWMEGTRIKGEFRLALNGHGWSLRRLDKRSETVSTEDQGDVSVISGRTLDHIELEYQTALQKRLAFAKK